MENNFDYYVLRMNSFPTLYIRGSQPEYNYVKLQKREPLNIPNNIIPVRVDREKYEGNLPKKDGDCYSLGSDFVFSQRTKEMIEKCNPSNIEFIPANIQMRDNETYNDYFILHIFNKISCMDKEKSEWEASSYRGEVLSIGKFIMDESKIKDIPLSERLIFALGECPFYKFFHKTIIDELEKIKPKVKGLNAVNLNEWDFD